MAAIRILAAIFLLGLPLMATALNITVMGLPDEKVISVYEWDAIKYEWPSDANVVEDKQEYFDPRYMAVYGARIFISLFRSQLTPATLFSVPTSSASSPPPKLTPFPSLDMHCLQERGNCNKIQAARGLEVDAVGRLWVLDSGNDICATKLWLFNLDNDTLELEHELPLQDYLHDLVLDETPNGWFAYITRMKEEQIVVFHLENNKSWLVRTPGVFGTAISISPKKEPRQIFLAYYNQLYSVSADELRNGTLTVYPKPIGNWTASPKRTVIDGYGNMFATFPHKNYSATWKISQPFVEQRFFQLTLRSLYSTGITLALDQNDTLWLTLCDSYRIPIFRLLKASLSATSRALEAAANCSSSCHEEHGSCLESAECFCKMGWKGENCDECHPYPGCVHGTCNQPWECTCQKGFEGFICDKTVCSVKCHKEYGFCEKPGECLCKSGWKGENCDQCQTAPGCVQGTCIEPGQCNCEAGWEGELCDKTICSEKCNVEHGFCLKPGECRCKVGWKGENCYECHAYPGCVNGTCDQPWECNCLPGFRGKLCNLKNK